MADASGSLSGGGSNTGLQMGRNRAHTKDQYTYLGEDNQTRPLEDLGNLLMGKYNQGRAQSNLAFGGRGYGNSFVPKGGGPAGPPPNPTDPTDSAGLGMKPQGGTIFPMMMRNGNGPNPYNPRLTDTATGPVYPGAPAYDPDQNNAEFGMGDYGDGVDYYTDPLDPGGDPSGGGDPDWNGGDPNGTQIDKGLHFNYLPGVDPNDGYFPRDPSILNDADNARPSPIRPQGASNDPWSTALTDGMDAPMGGLYSYLDQFASGERSPYESAIGDELMNLYQNPNNEYDDSAADTFNFARTGGMTDLEAQTRGYQTDMANGDMLDPAWETRGGYADIWKNGPSSTESQDRDLILGALKDFGPGGAYDAGSGGLGYSASSGGGGLGQAYSDALGGYEKILAAPGRTDAEKAAIIGEGMRTARAGFDTAKAEMERRQGITGNGAGFYDALAKIAGAQSNALGSTARQAQIDFANETARQREDALRGLSGLANTEEAAASRAAASANAAASRAAAMQQAQMQARLAGLGMLQGWDESQRKNQLAGLGGMERFDDRQNENRKYGITGLAGGDTERSKRMMSGAGGLADLGQNTFGRKAGALGAANQWAQQGVDARKFGTQGLAGLWQQQNQYNNDDLDRLIRLYTNPREKYQESYYTKGQGGFGGTGTL